MAQGRFEDRRVIVTGGASGIGRAIAQGFCREGAWVLVADLSADAAEATTRALSDAGGEAEACKVDVTDTAAVQNMVERAGDRLDVLVCTAGLFIGGSAADISDNDWKSVLDVNLNGTFYCARAASERMKERGGSIITFSSSTGAHDAIPAAAAYVASKGGVTMLTKAMAIDLAPHKIRVNAIAPGPTDTPMLRGLMSEQERIAFGNTLPVKRLGVPEEFVGAAMFLASDEASFVTGAILAVDGGQTALV